MHILSLCIRSLCNLSLCILSLHIHTIHAVQIHPRPHPHPHNIYRSNSTACGAKQGCEWRWGGCAVQSGGPLDTCAASLLQTNPIACNNIRYVFWGGWWAFFPFSVCTHTMDVYLHAFSWMCVFERNVLCTWQCHGCVCCMRTPPTHLTTHTHTTHPTQCGCGVPS